MAALNVSCNHSHIHIHIHIHSSSTASSVVPPTSSASISRLALSSTLPHLRSLSQQPFLSVEGKRQLRIYSRICTSLSVSSAMASGIVKEELPPALDSSSDPPAIFDGTPKLYISYACPYAQRVWIARNYKGLQEKIKLVPIDLQNRPAWYKEKVYPPNKVPSLEHNNEVKGESLDLLKYVETNFEGPPLLPNDPAKREFAEELLSYVDSFCKSVVSSFKEDGIGEAGAAFDRIENALGKFDDGPFFLGNFSLVDIAYAPFIERFQPFLLEVKKYDIAEGRPKLATWIQELNKIEAYTVTKRDPKELVESYKKRFLA